MLLLALAAQAALPAVDGTRLQPGTVCYAIARGETVMGATLQTVQATSANGAPAWDVVVHQRVGDKFDLRDHFVLRQKDLAPIAFDSRKSGVEHVRVVYGPGKLVTARPGAAPVEIALTGQVWEGNLWGLTFAALPLKEGAHFELPFYQYDKGLGRFSLDVVGSEKVGDRDAWIVETSLGGDRKVRYLIGKADHAELGYAGGGFAQRLGGDCSGIQ
ncbi:DUF3108 domain-containing protein [Sphingomonas sp. UNC305MFCol5.2]|uniref:DUF3108 domain-containing protein n=1 Tax=Sphingomonas sp. UNC305MFCol5.2 TaxID=1449076 RepID=UPI000411C209|nr:hypothetical protein [Sphingomonas sp. UNC305MFCol5.2]